MFFVFLIYRNRGVIFFMEIFMNLKFIMVIFRISVDLNWFDFFFKFFLLLIVFFDDDGRLEKKCRLKRYNYIKFYFLVFSF